MKAVRAWLARRWQPQTPPQSVVEAYARLFATPDGQVVLQHWMDECYATVCTSRDPIELATHNGRRSFVHEILQVVDQAQWPEKYGALRTLKEGG